ncbi:multicopper oxidase [Tunturiibacter empetritectus]|uniref:Spore coat protein A n=1 Tax=Tunturiibacter lichenicola TaxID=2051959 RepID=A0A852VQW2_9BACT|nr:multicopper oxidase [Edaphobacter lichenicola]NYF91722.1 spore coat protein A [Edaphobacter lichenicola]
MSPTRRTILQQLSALGTLASPPIAFASRLLQNHVVSADSGMSMAGMAPTQQSDKPAINGFSLTPFVDELPLPERARPISSLHPHKLRITMREIHAKAHRDIPPTRMWSYGDTALAPLIDVRAHRPLQVEWVNQLPKQHFLPIDHSLHGCGHDVPDVRACVHLHGGRTPSKDDGFPEDWFVPGTSRTCTYPLQQDAAALWYHDHAMGLNRLNTYAGLFGMMLLRDDAEDALNLPSGKYEIPLQIYDRQFTTDGQLYYPDSGDPEHPWVPEFGGSCILLNGKMRPYLEVEPRLYRFRLLNTANSSFFNLSLTSRQPFHQIGSDQGLLPAPVKMSNLLIAPAERADLLIDFSQAAGQHIHLINGAVQILEFRVAPKSSQTTSASQSSRIPNGIATAASIPSTLRSIDPIPESAATTTRTITLNEYLDKIGNSMLMLLNNKHWHEPVTETPRLNSTEIWEFVNLTEDTHPMHLHLVRFQVLDRRAFDVFKYRNNLGTRYLAAAVPPDPNETGWKDTVHCPAGAITRIIVHFDGYPGKYLYHCHILEHEANDMMRPFEVIA